MGRGWRAASWRVRRGPVQTPAPRDLDMELRSAPGASLSSPVKWGQHHLPGRDRTRVQPRHERAAKQLSFCRSDQGSLWTPPPGSRPDSTARWDSMAPLVLTPAPPYSLPQVQTFSIFKGTGHRKSSPPAGTQSAGPDPARSPGRGVYQEGSCGGRRGWRGGGGVAPEDRGRAVSGAAGSGLTDSARGPRHVSSSLGPASRAEPRKERMGLAGLGWTLGHIGK